MIRFRRGTEADIPKVMKLWFSMVRETHPDFSPNVAWWKAETLQHLRHNSNYFMFVAEEGGVIVAFTDGYIQAEPAQGKIFFFSRHSYVRQTYRHTNIIKELYHMVTEESHSRGVKDLMFCCPESTLAMWKTHGYHEIEHVMIGSLHDIPSTLDLSSQEVKYGVG